MHIVGYIFIFIVGLIPVKLACDFAGAKNPGFGSAAIATALGLALAWLGGTFLGNFMGSYLAGALGFALALKLVMQLSFVASVGVMAIAVGIFIGGVSLLSAIGVIDWSLSVT